MDFRKLLGVAERPLRIDPIQYRILLLLIAQFNWIDRLDRLVTLNIRRVLYSAELAVREWHCPVGLLAVMIEAIVA